MLRRLNVAAATLIAITATGVARAETLTLPSALAEARKAGTDLAVAKARVKVAESGFASANKLVRTNPQLSASYGTDAPFDNEGDSGWSLGLSHTLELGGQQSLRRDIVHADVSESVSEEARVRNQLLGDVVVAFYGLDTARRSVVVEKQIAALYDRLLVAARISFEKGGGSKLDLLTMQVETARINADLAKAGALASSLESDLTGLLGRTGAVALEPSTDDVPKIETFAVTALLEKALDQRSELAIARARRKSYVAQETLVGREVWLSPTISVGVSRDRNVWGPGGFIMAPGGVPGLLGVDTSWTLLNVGITIPLPFFDARASDRARAAAGIDLSTTEERAARVKIEAEVRSAVALANGLSASFASLEKARPAMKEALELIEKAFTKGESGISETLLGTERMLRAQLVWLAARGDYLRARALIDRAIGAWSS